MLWNERDAVQRAALTPATGLPVEMGMEALTAGFRFTRDEETSTSLERALWEEFDFYLDTVEQRTGKRVGNPIGGVDRIAAAQQALTPTGQPAGPPSLAAQLPTTMQDFEQQIGELRSKTPDLPAPPTAPELLDRITSRLGTSRERYEDLASRMTTGGSIANFIGSMGGTATDPVVAGTATFGAGAGRALASRMLVEAGVQGALQTLIEPGIHQTKEAIKSPYSVTQSAQNILGATLLGGAFPVAGALLHAGGTAAVRRLGRLFPDRDAVREAPSVPPAEALAATPLTAETIPPELSPEAPAVAAAGDAVTADELAALAAEGADIDRAMAALESIRPATDTERAALAGVERGAMVEESSPLAPDDLPAHISRVEDDAATLRETGEIPPRQEPAVVPVDPVRVAEVEAASTLDPVTRAELHALAAEDADLGRAMQAMESIRAFHGSPHRFERFSMEHIGTGEGAQAFGHGLYFAEEAQTAKTYKEALSRTAAESAIEWSERNPELAATARGQLKEHAKSLGIGEPDDKLFSLMLNHTAEGNPPDAFTADVADAIKKTWEKPEGHLYTVDLAVSRDELLDWDKPLSEQPARVREAFQRAFDDAAATSPLGKSEQNALLQNEEEGLGAGQGMRSLEMLLGSSEKASAALRAAGIRGIQYLDAGSRAGAEGTRNIVMFSDEDIRIREINGTPIPDPAEASKALAEFTGSDAETEILAANVERALAPVLTPEQVAAQKTLNRRIAAQKGALKITRDVVDAKGKPRSLLAWLKGAGGIKDVGGELKARDLQSSRPGLVRRTGHNIETAAFMAWEDGFLPEATRIGLDGGTEPDPDFERMFLQAIDDELRGKKRYSDKAVEETDAAAAKRAEAANAEHLETQAGFLEAEAAERGLDAPRAMIEEAVQRAAISGRSKLDELDDLIEADAMRLADDWEAAVDDGDAIPFEPIEAVGADRPAASAQQAAGGDAGGQAGVAARDQEPAAGGQAAEGAGARRSEYISTTYKGIKRKPIEVMVNPTERDVRQFIKENGQKAGDGGAARVLMNRSGNMTHAWDASAAIHAEVADYYKLGDLGDEADQARVPIAELKEGRVVYSPAEGDAVPLPLKAYQDLYFPAPRSEPGAEGFDQLIIPGAERSAQQAMDARAGRGIGTKAPQQGMSEGLFQPLDDPAQMEIPTAEGVTRTARDMLDELDADQRTIDAMGQCAAPVPVPGAKK